MKSEEDIRQKIASLKECLRDQACDYAYSVLAFPKEEHEACLREFAITKSRILTLKWCLE